MKPIQIVVLSGKGGTGKTSILASFCSLSKHFVAVDCDVDAANLSLLIPNKIIKKEPFTGGKKAKIISGHCIACGKCEEICKFGAIKYNGPGNGRVNRTFTINETACEGCGLCYRFCAENAIEFKNVRAGETYISQIGNSLIRTKNSSSGFLIHAELFPGEGNSGKLVSLLREKAGNIAKENKFEIILHDGSPGIGCPVIASLTGSDMAVLVAEPTVSGMHDLKRIVALTKQLSIKALVLINKFDINKDISNEIEKWCLSENCKFLGKIPYNEDFYESQNKGISIIEYNDKSDVSVKLKEIWESITRMFTELNK